MGQRPGGPRKPSRAEKKAAAEWVNHVKAAASDSADLETIREQIQGKFNLWVSDSPTHLRTFIDVLYSSGTLQEREAHLIGMVVKGADPCVTLTFQNPRNGRIAMSDQWAPTVPFSERVTRNALVFAGVAVAITFGAITLWPRMAGTVYRTSIGERERVPLQDGSVIFLNSASEIRVSFSRARREIELVHGEALFDVTHDKSRPMLVTSGTADIEVMGTQFDVVQRQARTLVAVVDGTVRVDGIRALTLSRGEYAEVEGKKIIGSGQADLQNMLSWHRVSVAFDRQPLVVVAEEFNRNSVRQLEIGPIASSRRISGRWVTSRPEILLPILKGLYPDLVVQETGNGWIVEAERKR